MNKVCIDSASEEAHTISGLRSVKVLVDPHTDRKRRKEPLEEDYRPSPTIILEEDSDDEEAPNEESRALIRPSSLLPKSSLYPANVSQFPKGCY